MKEDEIMKLDVTLGEKMKTTQQVFDGVLLHVNKDEVELPNGESSIREYIRLLGAVAIVPITEEGNVIVEKQYRYPLHRVVTEIPAGKIDRMDENPLDAAKRELLEETGFRAEKWTTLGVYQPSPAYCDERIYLYLAEGLEKGQAKLDEGEFLLVEEVPLQDLARDVMDGKIEDGKTQIAVMKALFTKSSQFF